MFYGLIYDYNSIWQCGLGWKVPSVKLGTLEEGADVHLSLKIKNHEDLQHNLTPPINKYFFFVKASNTRKISMIKYN
jgi:hypothetical protein